MLQNVWSVKFLSDLVLEHVKDDTFTLAEPFKCELIKIGRTPRILEIPEGFMTDLDSVPRIPVIYAVFKGRATKSAVLHDYLVRNPNVVPKRDADTIFFYAMKEEGVRLWLRILMYLAVRLYVPPDKNDKQRDR